MECSTAITNTHKGHKLCRGTACGGSKWDGESNKDVHVSWYWCSRKAVDSGVGDWMQYSILSLFRHAMRVNDNDFVDCMRKNGGNGIMGHHK